MISASVLLHQGGDFYTPLALTVTKWQKRVFALAKAQHETQFAEVTPVVGMRGTASVAMTIHVAGVSADIHNGADPSTVEAVLQILKRC